MWVDHGQGLALLEELRRIDALRKTPVLLVGTEPRLEVRVRAHELGAVGPAPAYEPSAFAGWIDAALERGGSLT